MVEIHLNGVFSGFLNFLVVDVSIAPSLVEIHLNGVFSSFLDFLVVGVSIEAIAVLVLLGGEGDVIFERIGKLVVDRFELGFLGGEWDVVFFKRIGELVVDVAVAGCFEEVPFGHDPRLGFEREEEKEENDEGVVRGGSHE